MEKDKWKRKEVIFRQVNQRLIADQYWEITEFTLEQMSRQFLIYTILALACVSSARAMTFELCNHGENIQLLYVSACLIALYTR